MAYASTLLVLALDLRVLDIPLKERLQSRTSDPVVWAKTMFPVIHQSIREARAQLRTGHHDIRTYFSDTAEPERNMNAMIDTATATIDTTTTDRIGPRRTDLRQRPQQTRNQPAMKKGTNYLKATLAIRATIGPTKETAMMTPAALNTGDRFCCCWIKTTRLCESACEK
jgi:hypothetical protein